MEKNQKATDIQDIRCLKLSKQLKFQLIIVGKRLQLVDSTRKYNFDNRFKWQAVIALALLKPTSQRSANGETYT